LFYLIYSINNIKFIPKALFFSFRIKYNKAF
jgi:hypothetical protein